MKKPRAPRLVTLAIFTTITITFWIFFSLYSIFTTKPPPEVDPKLLESIDPTFDVTAMSKIQGRIFVEESELSNISITVPPTPTSLAIPSPSVTESPPEITPETATESSILDQ